MKCIILASGYATRLYPLTLDTPKALLPLSGKPLLDYLIKKVPEDVTEIIVVSNEKFYPHFSEWAEGKENLTILNDGTTTNETRLGGIGDLWLAIEKENINEDILLLLGDNLFDFDLQGIVNTFKKNNAPTIGLYDIKDLSQARNFGILAIDENNKITSFEEKPSSPKSTLISTGVYLYPKSSIKLIEEYMKGDGSKEGPGYLIPYFMSKGNTYGHVFEGVWHDIGTKEEYAKLKDSWN